MNQKEKEIQERIDEGISQGFLEEAYDLLWSHYGRKFYNAKKISQRKDNRDFNTDCSNLWEAVQPTDGQLFLMAVKKHLVDHSDGNNAGDWMPTAANIAKHLSSSAHERKALQELESSRVSAEQSVPFDIARTSKITLTSNFLINALGRTEVECIPNSAYNCEACGDTGQVCFYYVKNKPSHIFLLKEFMTLANSQPDKAALFETGSCVCDECDIGTAKYEKFQHNHIHHMPPSYWTIKKLAKRRKEIGKRKQIEKEKLSVKQEGLF